MKQTMKRTATRSLFLFCVISSIFLPYREVQGTSDLLAAFPNVTNNDLVARLESGKQIAQLITPEAQKLKGYLMNSIVDILSKSDDPNSVKSLSEAGKYGFPGDGFGLTTAYSRVNEVLYLLSRCIFADDIGLPTDLASFYPELSLWSQLNWIYSLTGDFLRNSIRERTKTIYARRTKESADLAATLTPGDSWTAVTVTLQEAEENSDIVDSIANVQNLLSELLPVNAKDSVYSISHIKTQIEEISGEFLDEEGEQAGVVKDLSADKANLDTVITKIQNLNDEKQSINEKKADLTTQDQTTVEDFLNQLPDLSALSLLLTDIALSFSQASYAQILFFGLENFNFYNLKPVIQNLTSYKGK